MPWQPRWWGCEQYTGCAANADTTGSILPAVTPGRREAANPGSRAIFDITAAIAREKQPKRWNRAWKIALIEESNPTWRDLAIIDPGV
jgi:hypothetical protein